MFCKKCGKELNNNTKFCSRCGTPTSKPNVQDMNSYADIINEPKVQNMNQNPNTVDSLHDMLQDDSIVEKTQHTTTNNQLGSNKLIKFILPIAGCAAVLVVCIIVLSGIFGSKESKEISTTKVEETSTPEPKMEFGESTSEKLFLTSTADWSKMDFNIAKQMLDSNDAKYDVQYLENGEAYINSSNTDKFMNYDSSYIIHSSQTTELGNPCNFKTLSIAVGFKNEDEFVEGQAKIDKYFADNKLGNIPAVNAELLIDPTDVQWGLTAREKHYQYRYNWNLPNAVATKMEDDTTSDNIVDSKIYITECLDSTQTTEITLPDMGDKTLYKLYKVSRVTYLNKNNVTNSTSLGKDAYYLPANLNTDAYIETMCTIDTTYFYLNEKQIASYLAHYGYDYYEQKEIDAASITLPDGVEDTYKNKVVYHFIKEHGLDISNNKILENDVEYSASYAKHLKWDNANNCSIDMAKYENNFKVYCVLNFSYNPYYDAGYDDDLENDGIWYYDDSSQITNVLADNGYDMNNYFTEDEQRNQFPTLKTVSQEWKQPWLEEINSGDMDEISIRLEDMEKGHIDSGHPTIQIKLLDISGDGRPELFYNRLGGIYMDMFECNYAGEIKLIRSEIFEAAGEYIKWFRFGETAIWKFNYDIGEYEPLYWEGTDSNGTYNPPPSDFDMGPKNQIVEELEDGYGWDEITTKQQLIDIINAY